LSIFGRGYGEAICAHVGDGEWVLVDSCLHPTSQAPASLEYLTSVGVSAAQAVKLIVVTHWDDDHIRGIAKIVEECEPARVACSAALGREDVVQFVVSQEAATGAAGSGLDELRTILRLCSRRKPGIIWAKANLPLHPSPPGESPKVVALSPSEDATERSVTALIEAATHSKRAFPRRYNAPEGPNGASVATSLRSYGVSIVLGADLELSNNPETGWEAVLSYSRPPSLASLVKVPHHGSKGAHHDGFWTDCVNDQVIAILTPWSRGARHLPTDTDLTRLRAVANDVYLTAMPALARVEVNHEVQRLLRRLHGDKAVSELRGWGQVRARRRNGADSWEVELEGDAVKVEK
jgi:beta-lactamase superfamily II metal-dependent hydrolase